VASKIEALVAALAASTLIGATANPVPGVTTFRVPLSGAAESNFAHSAGGTGDLHGSGSVILRIDPANKRVCYDFRLSRVSTPLMAHIHQGVPLQIGPPVVTLFTGPGAQLDDCVVWLHGQLAAIVATPADYYVSIETTEYPDGALRGQLASNNS
jgi:hypothetical protein